jgi:hypothetical protein
VLLVVVAKQVYVKFHPPPPSPSSLPLSLLSLSLLFCPPAVDRMDDSVNSYCTTCLCGCLIVSDACPCLFNVLHQAPLHSVPQREVYMELRSETHTHIILKKMVDERRVTQAAPGPSRLLDPDASAIAKATALVKAGYVSRGIRSLFHKNATLSIAEAMEQLRPLHPKATGAPPMIDQPLETINVDHQALSKLIVSKLQNGSAAGPSGWTGELVAPLVSDPECLEGIATLVKDMLNGDVDVDSHSVLTASLLIPIPKEGGGVRPIAIGEAFYRLATMYGVGLVSSELPKIFEPIQLGVGARGGVSRALHMIQAKLEMGGPDTILLKCDIKNAFNERKREQILADLLKEEKLRPLWRFAHWAYRTPSPLLVLDHGVFAGLLMSEQGVRQGDGLASLLFSLSVQKFYERCTQELKEGKSVVKVAIADDFNILGPPAAVIETFKAFLREIKDSGLEVRMVKCGILWPHKGPVPAVVREFVTETQMPVYTGAMETLGSVVGFDKQLIHNGLPSALILFNNSSSYWRERI